MDWQPIETAPKDGTEVLLVRNGSFRQIGSWRKPCQQADGYRVNDGEPCWVGYSAEKRVPEPTHWMPLPEPPKGEA
jgi:hypothetical protein